MYVNAIVALSLIVFQRAGELDEFTCIYAATTTRKAANITTAAAAR